MDIDLNVRLNSVLLADKFLSKIELKDKYYP